MIYNVNGCYFRHHHHPVWVIRSHNNLTRTIIFVYLSGTNFSTIHHQISSSIKPIDNDEIRNDGEIDSIFIDHWLDWSLFIDLDPWNEYSKIKAWSTEKLLHPQEKSPSLRFENVSPYGKRRLSSNSSSLPKQVRFLYNPEHIRSYPQLSVNPRRDENHFANADVYQTFI